MVISNDGETGVVIFLSALMITIILFYFFLTYVERPKRPHKKHA